MFKSIKALRTFVSAQTGLEASELVVVNLGGGSKTLVHTGDQSKVLGVIEVTYMGMVPGYGKKFDITAYPV